ncbi:hypothetical protein AB0D08_04145 [Kitasatospora sp. NPDC048540]|uniref:hypothetical protein n=1 Tax=unclassified Kitasatospora TaxID=2633591 RepID=UPI000539A7CB|nr:hypothetical protein [Kitasatospora sp. MBT63]
MDSRQDDLRRDLDAAVQTRKELGKEYESEIVDSFLARLDARLDARVEQRAAEQLDARAPARGRDRGRGGRFTLGGASLVLGIPLTAIATENAGVTGLIVCWAGIVGVNLSAALGDRRRERELSRGTRSEWA